jgi:G3E family GTPase
MRDLQAFSGGRKAVLAHQEKRSALRRLARGGRRRARERVPLLLRSRRASVLGDVDVASLFSPTFFDEADRGSLVGDWLARGQATSGRRATVADDTHEPDRDGIESTTLFADSPLVWRELDLWLSRLQRKHADDLLRIKGIVHVAGEDRPVVVHGVQSVAHVPIALEAWPDADRRTRIVVIYRTAPGIDEDRLQESWVSLLARAAP